MSTPNPTPQPGRQTYMAPVADVYAAMVQMLGFNASFDLVHQDEQSHAVTFSAPNLNGLFTAKVVPGETSTSSAVEMTAPVDAGEVAHQLVMKFYKDLGDQLMAQTAVQATSAQTTAMNPPTQQTEVVPPVPAANTAPATPYGDQAAPGDSAAHRAPTSKFTAMLTDNNPGKTSTMVIVALAVAAAFLIFGFVTLGVHPPVALCIIFAVIAAALCVVAYMKTQPGKEHGRLFTVIAAGATVIGLVLSLVGAAGGKRESQPSAAVTPSSSASSSASSSSKESRCKSFSWPTSGAAAKIPAPKATKAMDVYEFAASYSLTACDVTASDFEDYVNELRGKGFTVGLAKSSDTFSAENAAGDKVIVMHNPTEDTMSISIESKEDVDREAQRKAEEEAAKQAEEQKKAEEAQKQAEEERKRQEEEQKRIQEEEAKKQQEAQNQAQSGGVTPAVKEAMDSYESFMNKYCDFMEKYTADGAPTSMLADYLKMMNEYSETTKKLDDMDQSTWTDADMQYYLEVMNRVNQRLVSVS